MIIREPNFKTALLFYTVARMDAERMLPKSRDAIIVRDWIFEFDHGLVSGGGENLVLALFSSK